MGSVNRVTLLGRIGRDAECRFTQSGTPVASFTMATTERYATAGGEKREDTQWHRIVLWGKRAEALSQYLTKGKQVFVDGKLTTREYEKDGAKQRITEVKVDDIQFVDSQNGGSRESAPAQKPAGQKPWAKKPETVSAPDDDAIPFAVLAPLVLPFLGLLG